MLAQGTRQAILELHGRGQGVRAIARALQVSRAAVREVLRRGSAEVPRLARPEKALEHRDEILRLLRECDGSFMRVHEELTGAGLQLSYPAFTAFCRRHAIGQPPRSRRGGTTSRPARRCSTIPRRTMSTSAAGSGACRRPASCSATRACSFSRVFVESCGSRGGVRGAGTRSGSGSEPG